MVLAVNTTQPGTKVARTGKARGIIAPESVRVSVYALADELGAEPAGELLGVCAQTVNKIVGSARVLRAIVTHLEVMLATPPLQAKLASIAARATSAPPMAATGTDG